MKSKDLRKKLLENNPEFKKEYLKRNLYLEISHIVVRGRLRKNLTQKELADLAGTKQSAISRLERGNTLPKIDFLLRVCEKLDIDLKLDFKNILLDFLSPYPVLAYVNSKNEAIQINNPKNEYSQESSSTVTSDGTQLLLNK